MPIKEYKLERPEGKYGLKGASIFNKFRNDKDILKTMDEDTYEELVASWAYWCLKEVNENSYEDVFRLGGSGDGGIDVIAYYDIANRDCDIYQCKHYDHPINRSDVIAELGKFLYHVYIGAINQPRNYYLMAPQGISGRFNYIYSDCEKLKKEIKESWNKDIADKIVVKKTISLDSDFSDFIDGFDFKKFKIISPDKFLEAIHRKENRHVYIQYFGVNKDEIERIKKDAPADYDEYESKYIQHLITAYNDTDGFDAICGDNVKTSCYGKHFERSRDQFWLAESIKKMSEENCPGDRDEFKELEDDMMHHVADCYEDKYENAYKRVRAVTDKATFFPKKENRIISGELSSGELKGVCFHLSNKDMLIWKEE